MPGTGSVQHRGPSVPAGSGLLQRIVNLETALGFQGASQNSTFAVYDAASPPNPRARMGYLPNGDYGLYVQDTLGNGIEVCNPVISYFDGTLTSTSTTPVNTNGPSCTVNIGASLDCILEVGSDIAQSVAGAGALIQIWLDGTVINPSNFIFSTVNATGRIYMYRKARYSKLSGVTALTAGKHTFSFAYSSNTNGDTATFIHSYLQVTPI